MTNPPHALADVREMGIVHSALRRDLERTRTVLESPEPISADRRQAIAAHLLWMMDHLHHHHTGEDLHLWPAVRGRNPGAANLLDLMEEDHQRLGPHMEAIIASAQRWQAFADERSALATALAALVTDLLPHLRREEEHMMPVVAETLSPKEFNDLSYRTFVKPKSQAELGREINWILDGLDETGRRHMLGKIPAPIAFFMLRAFGPGYRRKVERMWAGTPAAAIPSLSLTYLDRSSAA